MKYFAYGSNMNIKRMQARGVRVSSGVKGCLFGYSLKFNKISKLMDGCACANIVKKSDGKVEGILYDITDQCIENLDEYESYPYEYDRRIFSIKLVDGTVQKALAYVAQPYRTSSNMRPTKEYLSHLLCAEGLLSADYIRSLNNHKTAD